MTDGLSSVYFDLIRRYRPTLFFGVPTAYAAMVTAEGPDTLDTVRLCVSAGEPLPAAIWTRWKERFGVEILDGIESTEALHIYISNRPGRVRPGSSADVRDICHCPKAFTALTQPYWARSVRSVSCQLRITWALSLRTKRIPVVRSA